MILTHYYDIVNCQFITGGFNFYYEITSIYLKGYIALFNYLDQLRFDDSERSIKELAVDVLMNKVSDTNNDIRLRQVEYV